MGAFEFYLAFYGLLLGLSVAEVASGLLDAIGARERIRLGRLTPLLAAFVFLDITSFWIYLWGIREHVTVDWATMFGGLVVALTYYLAAELVFPRDASEWPDLDVHYRRLHVPVATPGRRTRQSPFWYGVPGLSPCFSHGSSAQSCASELRPQIIDRRAASAASNDNLETHALQQGNQFCKADLCAPTALYGGDSRAAHSERIRKLGL